MQRIWKLSFLTLIALAAVSQAAVAATDCGTDAVFTKNGWLVHNPAGFSELSQKILPELEGADFIFDTKGIIYSGSARRYVLVRSFDRLSTPQPEMYGDVVLVTDNETNKLVEIRWYESGKKQLVYDQAYQACATSLFPWANNTLF